MMILAVVFRLNLTFAVVTGCSGRFHAVDAVGPRLIAQKVEFVEYFFGVLVLGRLGHGLGELVGLHLHLVGVVTVITVIVHIVVIVDLGLEDDKMENVLAHSHKCY